MREIRTSGLMSGEGKRSAYATPRLSSTLLKVWQREQGWHVDLAPNQRIGIGQFDADGADFSCSAGRGFSWRRGHEGSMANEPAWGKRLAPSAPASPFAPDPG